MKFTLKTNNLGTTVVAEGLVLTFGAVTNWERACEQMMEIAYKQGVYDGREALKQEIDKL